MAILSPSGLHYSHMEDPLARSAYQIFLYVLLFVGTAALGGFVGYIVSFLYHEQRKEKSRENTLESEDDISN